MNEGFLMLLLVSGTDDGRPHIFVSPHPEKSQTKAHARACALALVYILGLLCLNVAPRRSDPPREPDAVARSGATATSS